MRMKSPPARVALLRPGALGDALLAFPTLAWLPHVWPGTRLLFVARAEVLPLVEAAGLADATLSFDDPVWGALWANEPTDSALLRDAVGGADAAVAWLRDADGTVARALGAAGVARVIVAPGQPANGTEEHVALYLARTLTPLGLANSPKSLGELAALLPSMVSAVGEQIAQSVWIELGLERSRVVALHPGSGGAAKCWPPECFAVIAAHLRHAGYTPLVIEGPADRTSVARLLAASSSGGDVALLVARDLTVEAVASVLARCAGYLGNDSGVSHLAALVGCPTLALFGPTDPVRWAPVGSRIQTMRGPRGTMDEIDGASVWDAFRRLL